MALMTTKTLAADYEKCGGYLRRKDATIKKPSPVLDVGEVLTIARAEIVALEDLLREVLAPSAIACSGEALEGLRARIQALGITKSK